VSTAAAPAAGSGRSREQSDSKRDRDPFLFKMLAGALILIAVLALVFGWRIERPDTPGWDVAWWVSLVAAAGLLPLSSGDDSLALSMDLPLLLGAAFVYGPVVAGTIAFLGLVDSRELRRLVSLTHAMVNRAQVSLSVVVAGVVFELAGGRVGEWPWVAIAGLLALAADVLVNYLVVATMMAVLRHKRLRDSIAEMSFGPARVFAPTYICFGFLGVLLSEAYSAMGLWGVTAFVVPIILARQAFLHRQLLDTALRSLWARKLALRHVDERIAEERRDERARIAEALHDDVLQCLYNVTLRTQVVREDLRSGRLLDLDNDVPAALDASEQAVEELRDVIRDLRKSPVGHAGLVNTLVLLVGHLRDQSGARFVTEIEQVRSDASTELLIYQIAREALTNAVKHAEASAIWLRLWMRGGLLRLEIEDDGRGFEPSSRRDPRHFGLELMRERAEAAGGRVEIRSRIGLGTTVEAFFPGTSQSQ
jgi:signal transduction histidine kinase